ncbi:MAG: excalibur calcium-binding domain-containing protein [Flexilinea sp.]
MSNRRKRKPDSKILGILLKILFFPVTILIWGLKKKNTPLSLLIITVWIVLYISTCSTEKISQDKQPTPLNQQTIIAYLVQTKVKENEPEPTETVMPTYSPTSTQIPTSIPESTEIFALMETQGEEETKSTIQTEPIAQNTVTLVPAANVIAELQPNDTGYSEAELIASGRSALTQPDGTKYFEGFFVLPGGNYWPLNSSALKGSSAGQILGSAAADSSGNNTITNSIGAVNNTAGQTECSPNYSVCLPIVGDLNCSDISYRYFSVTGVDVYKLDRDGNGIACESR